MASTQWRASSVRVRQKEAIQAKSDKMTAMQIRQEDQVAI
jgi:hypothetical protein